MANAQRSHQLVPVLGADGSALVLQLGPAGDQQIRHRLLQPSAPAGSGVFVLVGGAGRDIAPALQPGCDQQDGCQFVQERSRPRRIRWGSFL